MNEHYEGFAAFIRDNISPADTSRIIKGLRAAIKADEKKHMTAEAWLADQLACVLACKAPDAE